MAHLAAARLIPRRHAADLPPGLALVRRYQHDRQR
jgi:hypothetical protein